MVLDRLPGAVRLCRRRHDRRLDRRRRPGGVGRLDQRRGAAQMRRGHGGAGDDVEQRSGAGGSYWSGPRREHVEAGTGDVGLQDPGSSSAGTPRREIRNGRREWPADNGALEDYRSRRTGCGGDVSLDLCSGRKAHLRRRKDVGTVHDGVPLVGGVGENHGNAAGVQNVLTLLRPPNERGDIAENDLALDGSRETRARSSGDERDLSRREGTGLNQGLAIEFTPASQPYGGAEASVLGAGGDGQHPWPLVGDAAAPGAVVPAGDADENALSHRAESSYGDAVCVKGTGRAAEGQGSYVHSVSDRGV